MDKLKKMPCVCIWCCSEKIIKARVVNGILVYLCKDCLNKTDEEILDVLGEKHTKTT